MIREVKAKTAVSYHESDFPNNWDLNPYRGCGNNCVYCFAQYSHNYLNSDDFFGDIFVKTNIAERLHARFKTKSWKRDQVKIGGVTDSYQPLENKYKLMPGILDVFKKHRNPVLIATKSDLILRDIEIISEIAKITDVDIVTSITTMDETIRKIVEPNSSPSIKRLEMLREFNGLVRSTTLLLMPVMPFINDSYNNIEKIFKGCKESSVDNILVGTLHLRGGLKRKFFDFISNNFPQYYNEYEKLYKTAYAKPEYRYHMKTIETSLRKKYNLFSKYIPVTKPKNPEQLSLF